MCDVYEVTKQSDIFSFILHYITFILNLLTIFYYYINIQQLNIIKLIIYLLSIDNTIK